MEFHALSGMRDYIGTPGEDLREIIDTGTRVFRASGFREVLTPIMEDAALFDRSLGSGSDIVSKELYTIEQSQDRIIALRPENTAGVVRSVIENDLMAQHNQLKLFYSGPMFRHERPQSGRQRQFYQIGAEVFGREDSLIDAEIIQLGDELLQQCDVGETRLLLNSLGCTKCRPQYVDTLLESTDPFIEQLCEDCHRRRETNPLRLLDCKKDDCQSIYEEHAPRILDYLCDECDAHFSAVKKYLQTFDVPFDEDPFLVRGLDYYRRTAFEFVSNDLGSQSAVLAGGRYDGLVEELGGDPCPAIGFAAGIERMMILRGTNENSDFDTRTDCYFVAFSDENLQEILPLSNELRSRYTADNSRRIRAEVGQLSKSVKSQLRKADRYGADFVVFFGDDEMEQNQLSVKDMESGDQERIEFNSVNDAADRLTSLLETA